MRILGKKSANVVHGNKEFTRDLDAADHVAGLSDITGTQMQDRAWKTLCNSYIPKEINTKVRCGTTQISATNPLLWQYCWGFAARHNLCTADRSNLWTSLGMMIKESQTIKD